MPVLNLAEFLQMLEHEDGSYGRVSLQLFQAVMFAGSAFVDLSYLRKAGFSSRREAHKNFFHRARVRILTVPSYHTRSDRPSFYTILTTKKIASLSFKLCC